MKKDKLVIGGMVMGAVVVVIAFFMLMRQPKPPVPVGQQETPVPINQQEPPVPDVTIEAEFCRNVITKAQLREITGYQGEFIFTEREESDPILGSAELCIISAEIEGDIVTIGVADLDFETAINKIKLEDPDMHIALKEIDNVGEKAVIIDKWGGHTIFFSDGDINRLVGVVSMGAFTRGDMINLARQVEANIR